MIYSYINENFLFSTKKDREKMKESIYRVDRMIGAGLEVFGESLDIVEKALKAVIVPPGKEDLKLIAKFQDQLHKQDIKLSDAIKDIKKDYSGNVFDDMKKKKFSKRADLKHEEVSKELDALIAKCSEGGLYYEKCARLQAHKEKMLDTIQKDLDKLYDKYDFEEFSITIRNLRSEIIDKANHIFENIGWSGGDIIWVRMYKESKIFESVTFLNDSSFDDIKKQREQFQRNHDDRMKSVKDALDSFNKTRENEDVKSDNEEELNSISAKLKALKQ